MSRYTPAEKLEIIRLVEESDRSVKETLAELDIPRSTFYSWAQRYEAEGFEGLVPRHSRPGAVWNRIPEPVREHVVEVALEHPEKSPRELAWFYTDIYRYFISESSVYRLLKARNLVTSPVFSVIKAADVFEHPTLHVNEMWQIDFSQLKVQQWGWYYLCTVLDDYSRYILSWQLSKTMNSKDARKTLSRACQVAGISEETPAEERPRVLSDNGSPFISAEMQGFLNQRKIKHVRGAPYHPQTQGKIERYHRSMKNVIKLDNYYFPWDLRRALQGFADYYNHHRYHESLDNMTPATVYLGREQEVKAERERIKQRTIDERRWLRFLPAT
jgi:transposase InsO family protein/transposase-like protein